MNYSFDCYPLLFIYNHVINYNSFFTVKKNGVYGVSHLRNIVKRCYIRFHIAYHSDTFKVCIDRFSICNSDGNAEASIFYRKCFVVNCPVSSHRLPELIGYHVFM